MCIYEQENLMESKHHKMARSLRTGPTDRDLKPDARTRDTLKVKFFSYENEFGSVCDLWQLTTILYYIKECLF